MITFFYKHRAFISYVFFGVLTTCINIISFAVASKTGLSTAAANIVAWIVAVSFAYITNRLWVFNTENHSCFSIIKEVIAFISCRLVTGVIDEIIMITGIDYIGAKYISSELLFGWSISVKIFANALVIILNFIFSKLVIFTRK